MYTSLGYVSYNSSTFLWQQVKVRPIAVNALKCFFFNYRCTFSVTQMFIELGLPTCDTLMHSSGISSPSEGYVQIIYYNVHDIGL